MMQFVPADAAAEADDNRWDLSFRSFMEIDPVEWTTTCGYTLDSYLACMSADAIVKDCPLRQRVRALIGALAAKYPESRPNIVGALKARMLTLTSNNGASSSKKAAKQSNAPDSLIDDEAIEEEEGFREEDEVVDADYELMKLDIQDNDNNDDDDDSDGNNDDDDNDDDDNNSGSIEDCASSLAADDNIEDCASSSSLSSSSSETKDAAAAEGSRSADCCVDDDDDTIQEDMDKYEERLTEKELASVLANIRAIALEEDKDNDGHVGRSQLWLQNYDRIKYAFEMRVVKIFSPPVFLTVMPISREGCPAEICTRSFEQINHMYRDLYYYEEREEGMKKLAFLTKWLADDTKRTYLTCNFDPKGTAPYNFNTYTGFAASTLRPVTDEEVAGRHVERLITHIRDVFCSGDESHTDYVLKWFASIIKFPWKKTEVLLLIFGSEGCWKSLIIDFFARNVLGHHLSFQTASPAADLFSKFALGAHRKLLCFCDEGGEELSKFHDQLKNLITARTVRIEAKGQDIRLEDNYTNIIVASNNPGPVRVSPYDRRVVAFQCNDVYKGNVDYFTELGESLRSSECARCFYDYLMVYPVDEHYNFQAFRPITPYYESLQAASLPLIWRYLSFRCNTATSGVTLEASRKIFQDFCQWKSERQYSFSYTEARFGREFGEMCASEDSGVVKLKRSAQHYELYFDKIRIFLIERKRFDENAF